MAFKQILRRGKAIRLGNGKDETKSLEGYLVGFRHGIGKNDSTQWELERKDGSKVLVWGSAQIDMNLGLEFDPKKESQAIKADPQYMGVMVRFTFEGTQKVPGRKKPMRLIKIEIDSEQRLTPPKKGKEYVLKSAK